MEVYVMTCDDTPVNVVVGVYSDYQTAMEEADELEDSGEYPVDSLFVDAYTVKG